MAKGVLEVSNQRDQSRTFGFVLAIFFVLLLGTLAVWQMIRVIVVRAEQQVFTRDIARVERLLFDSVEDAKTYMDAFQALFSTDGDVTFGEYMRVYEIVHETSDTRGIVASAYLPLVSSGDTATFEEEIRNDTSYRAQGFPNFSIFPEGSGSERLPVTYVAPLDENNLQAQGFDVFSEPTRKAAIEKARDLGTITVTDQIDIVRGDNPEGFVFFSPVYDNTKPTGSVSERRSAFKGVLSVVFESSNFLNQAIDELFISHDVDIEVYDGEATPQNRFFDRHAQSDISSAKGDLVKEFTVLVADHIWSVRMSLTAATNPFKGWGSSLVLAVGVLLSFLIALSVRDLIGARTKALHATQGMVAKLRRTQQEYDEVLEGSPDAITTIDLEGRVLSINHATEDMLGYSRQEVLGKFFAETGILPPSSIPSVLKKFTQIVATRQYEPYRLLLKHKDGTEHMYEVVSKPLLHDGQAVRIQSVLRPLLERNKLINKIEAQETELKEMNHFIVEQERRILTLEHENEQLKKQLGQKPEQRP